MDFINDQTPDKVVKKIPTPHWMHLITTPFDLQEFKKVYPEIDVHKNNPTILFIP
jgi:hypothetical protein